jgi:hypothetical protein
MSNWKYTDASNTVAFRVLDNESMESCLASMLSKETVVTPADPLPTPDYSAMRKAAYTAESDPIFFMSQRGEATQADWLAKVAEIKARWP